MGRSRQYHQWTNSNLAHPSVSVGSPNLINTKDTCLSSCLEANPPEVPKD